MLSENRIPKIGYSRCRIPKNSKDTGVIIFDDGSEIIWKPLVGINAQAREYASKHFRHNDRFGYAKAYLLCSIKSWKGFLDISGKKIPLIPKYVDKLYDAEPEFFNSIYQHIQSSLQILLHSEKNIRRAKEQKAHIKEEQKRFFEDGSSAYKLRCESREAMLTAILESVYR